MKKIQLIISLVILSIIFSLLLTNAQGQEELSTTTNSTATEEATLPELSEKQLGPFKEIDNFIRKHFAAGLNKQYFLLNPAQVASQQGVVESFDGNSLVVSSYGFKVTWSVATDTKLLSARTISLLKKANPVPISTSSINIGGRVKIHGKWDGAKLVAKRVILLQQKQLTLFMPIKPTSTSTTTPKDYIWIPGHWLYKKNKPTSSPATNQ